VGDGAGGGAGKSGDGAGGGAGKSGPLRLLLTLLQGVGPGPGLGVTTVAVSDRLAVAVLVVQVVALVVLVVVAGPDTVHDADVGITHLPATTNTYYNYIYIHVFTQCIKCWMKIK
jgi:hypothetical protein